MGPEHFVKSKIAFFDINFLKPRILPTFDFRLDVKIFFLPILVFKKIRKLLSFPIFCY